MDEELKKRFRFELYEIERRVHDRAQFCKIDKDDDDWQNPLRWSLYKAVHHAGGGATAMGYLVSYVICQEIALRHPSHFAEWLFAQESDMAAEDAYLDIVDSYCRSRLVSYDAVHELLSAAIKRWID